ncbi:MAG TPA: NfeD family protein [Bacillota bacterium]|nr:NfeD family protein [Bacillota bacterium]HPT86556.1 NfeD family protein [Bacillota bacterium]
MDLLGFIDHFTIISALFFIFGLVLIVVEMFHPGFGVPGVTGVILLFFAVSMTATSVLEALVLVGIILVILGVVLKMVLQSAKEGRLAKTLVLTESLRKESGYSGTEDLQEYLGKEGITLTTLRPAGIAEIDRVKLDVVSEGEYIEKGRKVTVVKTEGRRVVVQEVRD